MFSWQMVWTQSASFIYNINDRANGRLADGYSIRSFSQGDCPRWYPKPIFLQPSSFPVPTAPSNSATQRSIIPRFNSDDPKEVSDIKGRLGRPLGSCTGSKVVTRAETPSGRGYGRWRTSATDAYCAGYGGGEHGGVELSSSVP